MTIREYIAKRRSAMFKGLFVWFVLVLITAAYLDVSGKGAPNMIVVIVVGSLVALAADRVVGAKCPRCKGRLAAGNKIDRCPHCEVSLDQPMP